MQCETAPAPHLLHRPRPAAPAALVAALGTPRAHAHAGAMQPGVAAVAAHPAALVVAAVGYVVPVVAAHAVDALVAGPLACDL